MSSAAARVALQDRIRRIERPNARSGAVLPLGHAAIDRVLPGGGLALGALHEILGTDGDEEDGAAAAGFAAALAGRIVGRIVDDQPAGVVLWALPRGDLYGPGLAAFGLDPARVVRVMAARDADILWALEEALRAAGSFGGIVAAIGEIARLPMVAGRRLQLAAERAGATALVLRRWRHAAEAAAERTRPSAATTRWRVAALPALPMADAPGIGRPRWRVELLRCRGGTPASWELELPSELEVADASDPVRLPAALADRPAAPQRPHAEPRRRVG